MAVAAARATATTLSGGAGGDGGTVGSGSANGAGGGGTGTANQGGAAGTSSGGTNYGAPGQSNQGGSGTSPAFGGGAGGGGAGFYGGGSGGGSAAGAGGGGGGSYYTSSSAANVVMRTGASAGQVAIGYNAPNNAPPPPPPVTIVQPHPAITGVAAIGSPLNCNPGVPVGAQSTLTYQWLRDTQAIAGATASQYIVVAGDSTHHLQCQVVSTNSAGSASRTSTFVGVPAQGVPASVTQTIVGHARDRFGHPFVNVICSPQTPSGCNLTLIATTKETLRGSKVVAVAARASAHAASTKTVTVAKASVHIASGQSRGISLALTFTGTQLLKKQRKLPAQLTVSGTLVGLFSGPIGSPQNLTLVAPRTLKARRLK